MIFTCKIWRYEFLAAQCAFTGYAITDDKIDRYDEDGNLREKDYAPGHRIEIAAIACAVFPVLVLSTPFTLVYDGVKALNKKIHHK